jgi:nicotinamidase-related amidase
VEELGTNTALLIIDVQRDLFEKSTPVYQGDLVLKNINALVDRAHVAGVPVFYVQHSTKTTLIEGSSGWQLHPALKPRKTDHFIRKHHGNAFEDTRLKGDLDTLRVSRVVVVGLITDGCVQATCKGAHALGYHVTLVEDAHSTNSAGGEQVIDKWNTKLSRGIVRLRVTTDVDFGTGDSK